MNKDNKSRDIFYGVVAIATLIVAIVGATLAYFSISATSEEGAVNAKAAVIRIEYADENQVTAQAEELIPSSIEIMQYYYEMALASDPNTSVNKCIDDNGKDICSAYRFSISSTDQKTITAMLNTEENGFSYLKYAVRDVSGSCQNTDVTAPNPQNNTPGTTWAEFEANYTNYTSCWLDLGHGVARALATCSNNDNNVPDCYTTSGTTKTYNLTNPQAVNSVFGYTITHTTVNNEEIETSTVNTVRINSTPKIYDVILFIENEDHEQDEDQGKEFHGNITVELDGVAEKIQGEHGD